MHEFLKSGEALGQAVSPHAGELSVGEQRGGFTGYRLCRRPLQNSMTGWLDDMMSAGGWQAAGLGLWLAGWPGESANGIRAHLWPLKKHCRHQPGLAGWLGWPAC